MKKIILIPLVFIACFSFGQAQHKGKFGVYSFEDTVYFKNVPYNSGAGIVALGIDTVAGSPTFGKLVRKTASASASTPTLQQVFNTQVGGSVLTKNDTINASTHNILIDSATVLQFRDENHNLRYYQDDAGSAGGTTIFSPDGGKSVTVTNSKVWLFTNNVGDSIGSTVLPFYTGSRSTAIVQDSLTGKWYRRNTTSFSKGVFVASPTSADTIDVWQTPVAITITSLKAILRGSSSPSVTFNIGFGTSIQSPTAVFTADITCTSITTGCSNSSGFNDATIPAGSFIWIYTNAQSGTVRSIAFTINYTED